MIPGDLYPETELNFESLWKQSSPVDRGKTRVLFQRYRIERVKGFEVLYETPASTDPRKLWIVGDRKRVVAPQAPLSWGRVVLAALAAPAVVVPVLFALYTLLLTLFIGGSRPDRSSPAALTGHPSDASTADRAPDGSRTMPVPKVAAPGSVEMRSRGNETRQVENINGSPAGGANRGAEEKRENAASSVPSSGRGESATDPNDEADGDRSAKPAPTESTGANTFEVLVGVYADADEAREVANRVEEAAYPPTVTPTQDPNDLVYVVSIKGFDTRESAAEAVQDLRERGISAQVRAAPD